MCGHSRPRAGSACKARIMSIFRPEVLMSARVLPLRRFLAELDMPGKYEPPKRAALRARDQSRAKSSRAEMYIPVERQSL